MNLREFFTTNTWGGKLLGGLFGYLIAGSAGALFGILLGNFFDRGLASIFLKSHSSYLNEKRQAVQKIFFEATFSVMGNIAKADGRVSENEIAMARLTMIEMQLNYEQQNLAKSFFINGKKSSFNLEIMLTQLLNACTDNRELLKLFMDIQYRAAQVDTLSAQKIQKLDAIFRQLGFAPLHQQYRFYENFTEKNQTNSSQDSAHSRYSSNRQSYRPNSQDALASCYALLEVKATASKQEVKGAYRRLISRNHPDKLIAQGLPEEMIKVANDKTQKITKAYEQIRISRGW